MRRATVVSLVVFFLLLALVLLQVGRRAERGMRRMDLSGIAAESVERIRIQGPQPVELERRDSGWFVAGRPANENSVKTLLDSLGRLKSSDLVGDDAERLLDFGLDEAAAQKVELHGAAGRLAEFAVGKAAGGGAYVQVDDGVFLVKQVFPRTFARKLSDWHELKLFSAKLDQVQKVGHLPAPGQGFTLLRKDGAWALEDPSKAPANFRLDEAAARRWAGSIVNARAGEIVLDGTDAAKAGLEGKFERFRFETEGGDKGELQIGAAHGEHDAYARVAGRDDLFVIREYSLKALRKPLADLRAMNPLVFDGAEVERLEIRDGVGQLVLVKGEGGWKTELSSVEAPPDFTLEPAMVEGRLRALASLKGERLGERRGELNAASVKLGLAQGGELLLELGPETKEGDKVFRPARGNADEATYLLSKPSADRILGLLPSFKRPDLPPGARPGGLPQGLDPKTLKQLPPEVRAKLMQQLGQR